MACVQEKRNALRVLLGNPEEKRSPGDLCVDGWTVLKLLQKEQVVRSQTLQCCGYGQVAGSFEHGYEPSGSIKCT